MKNEIINTDVAFFVAICFVVWFLLDIRKTFNRAQQAQTAYYNALRHKLDILKNQKK